MSQKIEILIEGPNAREDAELFAAWIQEEFGQAPTLTPLYQGGKPDEHPDKILDQLIDYGSFVLLLMQIANEAKTLTQNYPELAQKWDRMLERMCKRQHDKPELNVVVQTPHRSLPLIDTTSDDLVEADRQPRQ